jgi:hypothetical protein
MNRLKTFIKQGDVLSFVDREEIKNLAYNVGIDYDNELDEYGWLLK